MTYKASCCCGAASIEVSGEPALNGICNCSSCKKRTGSAFGWSVYFADGDIVGKTGELKVYAKTGPAAYDRFFCAHCGTTLFWKSFAFMPDHTGIAGGCFADDSVPPPAFSASDSGRCAWVEFPAEWPKGP